jgi:hypothetical protein
VGAGQHPAHRAEHQIVVVDQEDPASRCIAGGVKADLAQNVLNLSAGTAARKPSQIRGVRKAPDAARLLLRK